LTSDGFQKRFGYHIAQQPLLYQALQHICLPGGNRKSLGLGFRGWNTEFISKTI
jgi:hypothetical protein